MRNSRGNSTPAQAAEAAARWLRSDRHSLSIALLLSVCAHVALLGAWQAQRGSAPIQPALVVVMTGVIVAPKREAPPAPVPPPSVQEAAAQPVAPQRPESHAPVHPVAPASAETSSADAEPAQTRSLPADLPAAQPEPTHAEPAPAAPAPVAAAASAAATASSGAANPPAREASGFDEASYYRPDQVTQGPVPDAAPPSERLAEAKLVARRLVLQVFVDADGSVRKAVVVPYELSAQTAAMLADAIATMHFTPANIDGKPVPAVATSRLCFDDHGLLDTTSPECWQFDTRPAH